MDPGASPSTGSLPALTEVVSDVSITDGTQAALAITFHTLQDGLIIKQVEFWPENYPAPENRKHLVERME